MKQFNREYVFSAGKAGQRGFEVSELHIRFQIQKADCETPNTSKITLWNLSPAQLSELDGQDCIVTLRAGYKGLRGEPGSIALIFAGAVSYVQTSLDGSDRMTEIEAVDGRIELRDSFVSLSYNGKINSRKIIEDTAAAMGLTLTFAHDLLNSPGLFADIPNGYSFIGAAKSALDKICGVSNLTWGVHNGILQVGKKGGAMSKEVFLLSPDTGLIHIPKKISYGSDASFPEGRSGYEAQYLLNGAIGVNDYVRLDSAAAQGYFRVYSIDMDGDNLEGGWICTAKLLEL